MQQLPLYALAILALQAGPPSIGFTVQLFRPLVQILVDQSLLLAIGK
jgi:hypothetical protein